MWEQYESGKGSKGSNGKLRQYGPYIKILWGYRELKNEVNEEQRIGQRLVCFFLSKMDGGLEKQTNNPLNCSFKGLGSSVIMAAFWAHLWVCFYNACK